MGAPDPRAAGPQGRRLSQALRPLDVVGRIEVSLAGGGFTVTRDSVAGRQAVIARTARFTRGARRHVFVLLAVFKAGMAGREHLDRFLDEAGQYAATVKAGLVSGASAMAVAVVEACGHDDPGDWAMTPPGRPPAGRAAAFPVLVDVATHTVACPPAPADQHRLVQVHVVPSVGSDWRGSVRLNTEGGPEHRR